MNAPEWFVKLMGVLTEAYEQDMSMTRIDIYWRTLNDIPQHILEEGIYNLIRTRGTATLPKVAEIRAACLGDSEDKAVVACMKIEKALREASPYANIVFDDIIIHSIISNYGGWERLCQVSEQEWTFLKKDFEKQYRALACSNNLNAPPVLKGILATPENERMLKMHNRQVPTVKIGFNQGSTKKIDSKAENRLVERF